MRYDLVDRFYPAEPDPAFRRRAAWLLARLQGGLPRGAEVLDAGCGQGFYFPLYAELGLQVTGIETDPLPLKAARATAAATGARVVAAPAEVLPFPAASFDAVVLSEVLEHLDDPAPALAEAARVLRPGGLLLVTVPHAAYPLAWDPVNRLREGLGLPPMRRGMFAGIWANHQRLYRPDDLCAQVAAAGFQPEAVLFQTRACLPFVHNLVYGLGRALLEGGLLPRRWLWRGLRGAPPAADPGPAPAPAAPAGVGARGGGGGVSSAPRPGLNPIRLMIALIRRIDRPNPDFTATPGPAVNLCLAARRIA